jgi:hypothetical protein
VPEEKEKGRKGQFIPPTEERKETHEPLFLLPPVVLLPSLRQLLHVLQLDSVAQPKGAPLRLPLNLWDDVLQGPASLVETRVKPVELIVADSDGEGARDEGHREEVGRGEEGSEGLAESLAMVER